LNIKSRFKSAQAELAIDEHYFDKIVVDNCSYQIATQKTNKYYHQCHHLHVSKNGGNPKWMV